MRLGILPILFFKCIVVLLTIGCHHSQKPPDKDVVTNLADLEERISDNIKSLLDYSVDHKGNLSDTVNLRYYLQVIEIYRSNNFAPLWSRQENWLPVADSLYEFLTNAPYYGLFPSDYERSSLTTIKQQIDNDSLNRKDAVLWTKADVLLTNSYLAIAKDLKLGRLERDSITIRNDSLINDSYFKDYLLTAIKHGNIITSLQNLEPTYKGYHLLKEGIKHFIDTDTLPVSPTDSSVRQFNRIAITLDRYKSLPDTVPPTFVFVNIPAYTLYVHDADTLAFQSKIIVGTPATRTPVLTSVITNFITYPQWTVPYSIIFKEMLPGIKKDINYLHKKNLMVVDKNDSVIDPYTIDWSKLGRNRFPYLLRQRQGDDNSLGVMKFNFRNKYSVYLHDTNARSLFSRSYRALSHGCVRVEKWEALAQFLVRKDTIRFSADTLKAWIVRGEKHTIAAFEGVPLYIRYFTVEGKGDGTLKFYKDIYKEDSILNAKYFANKRY